MQTIFKLFKILIVASIIIFVFTCTSNSSTLNIAFIAILLAWIVIQIKESRTLPAFDSLFVMQILCEIAMIALSIVMLPRQAGYVLH
jgi:hypothetical protein